VLKLDKPKTLPPTLRSNRRYIAYEAMSENKIGSDEIMNAMLYSCLNLLGEKGTSEAQMWIIKNTYDSEKNMGLIKCNHKAIENIRAALSLIQRIGDSRVIIRVLGVSGTIKAAKQKYFGEVTLKNFTE